MAAFADYDDQLRDLVAALLRFDTTDGNEAPAQSYLREYLEDHGFSTYTWEADADRLADHHEFPDDPADIPVTDRPSVAGVLEFGDPDGGPTLVLNGHIDVVPVDPALWSGDPFEPTWDDGTLTARGAADMKAALGACVVAAEHLAETHREDGDAADLDGRIVVESVAAEEEGGMGAAAAMLENPYPFERDAAIVAEPTELTPVVAVEGTLMMRLELTGRQAHAASRWRGEDVLLHFEAIRAAIMAMEAERDERVTHPLYEEYPIKWPAVIGRVEAGRWASNVPANLTAEMRLGVAPGETLEDVEADYRGALEAVVADSEWLADHPPAFERFTVQFSPAEIDPDEPIVGAVQDAMGAHGLAEMAPRGATYGADSRHFVNAGIPAVCFGPGTIEQAHFPDESIEWADVLTAGAVIADAAERFLRAG